MSREYALIGISGVHYVVSELSRRGMVALPTIRNTAAYDIVVVNQRGTKHTNIQVKTSSKKTTVFQMPAPEKVKAGARDIYVLVRWLEEEKKFEGFLLTGREAKKSVMQLTTWQKRNIRRGTRKVLFPAIDVYSGSKELGR